MFDSSSFSCSIVGFIIFHVIDDLPGVSIRVIVMFVLLSLLLGAVLSASSGTDQLVVEVVVVVFIEISIRHGESRVFAPSEG